MAYTIFKPDDLFDRQVIFIWIKSTMIKSNVIVKQYARIIKLY